MAERYTRKDVEAQFERFVKAIGGRVAASYNDDGAYMLDHNSTYGGYNIMRLVGTGGGQTHVCGAMRRGPTAMIETLSFAIDALYERERLIQEREARRCTLCLDVPGLDGLGRTCKGCNGTGYVAA